MVSDTEQDVLKIVVLNRYKQVETSCWFYPGTFGIKSGALASSVAHDSHNIVAVGVEDELIVTGNQSRDRRKRGRMRWFTKIMSGYWLYR